MRTNLNKTNLTLRNSLSLPTLRAVLMVLLIAFGIGNAWANSSTTYYSRAGVKVASGSGTVYVKKSATTASASSKDKSTTGTSFVYTDNASSTTQNFTTNYAICAVPGTDYRFDGWTFNNNWSTKPTATDASTYGVVKGASSSSNSPTTGEASAKFVQISIASVTPTSKTLNPTDARTSCTDYTGTVTFTTTNDNASGQIGEPAFSNKSGSGTWEASNSWVAGTSTVTYTFKGNGYYGGSSTSSGSRNNSATLTLPTAGGTSSKSVTFTANFPSLVIADGATDVVSPKGPTDDGDGTVTFDVTYCDGLIDFPTITISDETGGTWTKGTASYTQINAATGAGTLTIPFTFNAGGATGDFSAKLTLTPATNTGASAKEVTLSAHVDGISTNDASVTPAGGSATEYATFAEALAAANNSDGCTLKLLRDVEGITASQEVKRTMTLDLNRYSLSGTLSAAGGLLKLNTAGKVLTITDTQSGGKISVSGNLDGRISAVDIQKGSLVLSKGDLIATNAHTGTTQANIYCATVYLAASTTMSMTNGTITANRTGASGNYCYGIYCAGTGSSASAVNLTGGTITANFANGNYAEGVYAAGTSLIQNMTISGSAKTCAYAIWAQDGHLVVNGGTYTGTTSASTARAIYTKTNPATKNALAVNNATLNATAGTTDAKGLYCQSTSTTISEDPTEANINLSNVTITAKTDETTGTEKAYAIYTDAGVCLAVNGGIYNATTKTTGAYAVRSGGYTAILNGTFNANATTYLARALNIEAGITAVRNGTFNATATTEQAHAAVVATGAKLLVYGGTFTGRLTGANANAWATGTYVNGGALEAQGGEFIGEVAKSGLSAAQTNYAAGIYAKTGDLSLSSATLRGKTDNDYVNGAYALYTSTANASGLTNCALQASSTWQYAYGIYNNGTPLTVKNSSININTIKAYDYGIWNQVAAAKTEIENSTITCTSGTTYAYGAYVNNGTLTAKNSSFNATVQRTGATSAADSYLHGIFVNTGKSATLTGCTITATGSGSYSNNGYGVYVHGTADIEDCTINVSGINSGAYAICNSANTTALNIASGKFKATATSTGISCNGTADAAKQKLYGGYYNTINNLEKYLPEGYGIETLPTTAAEYAEGYRYAIRSSANIDPVCKIGSTPYTTLEEALEFVNKNSGTSYTILMVKNYTLPAGDYTLPAKATLLVPYKSDQTSAVGTGKTGGYVSSYVVPSRFRKLTFADGVKMTVFGTIEVSAEKYLTSSGATGIPSGPYGQMVLEGNAHIDLEENSKLVAWGYVTGSGDINAKNKSSIYEMFQLLDMKGGGVTSQLINDNRNPQIFPITHYAYQNVEATITYRPGSKAIGWAGANVQGSDQVANDVMMVGNMNSGALFLMDDEGVSSDTWVRKHYDPTTDRAEYTLNNTATLGNINVNLSSINLASAGYILPIASNMTITLKYGTMTITQNTYFMPGSILNIEKESTLTIPSGKELYFVDKNQWVKGYAPAQYVCVVPYSPSFNSNKGGEGKTYSPRKGLMSANTNLPSAELFVHGDIVVSGALYTTADGANIHSTNADAGKITFNSIASNKDFCQLNSTCGEGAGGPGGSPGGAKCEGTLGKIQKLGCTTGVCDCYYWNWNTWPCTSAQLKNESGFTSSVSEGAGTYVYKNDSWTKIAQEGCFVTETDGSGKHYYATPSDVVEVTRNADNSYRDVASGFRRFVWDVNCEWWEVETTPTAEGYYKSITADHNGRYNYYEYNSTHDYWEIVNITITWSVNDATTNYSVGYGTHPKYLSANPTKPATSTNYYTWIGWAKGSTEGEFFDKDAELPEAFGATTYYAIFETHKYQYTVTFKNYDGSVLQATTWEAGQVPYYLAETDPVKPATAALVYTFTGWSPEITAVTGAGKVYTAQFDPGTPRTYTVQWVNYNGTVLKEEQVAYNTTPSAPVAPTRPNDNYYTYTFNEWTPAVSAVTGNQTYTATYNYEKKVTKYDIKFNNGSTTLYTQSLPDGETPVYGGSTPTKDDAQYIYTFDGWANTDGGEKLSSLPTVNGAAKTYYAVFTKELKSYTIRWKSIDDKQTYETDNNVQYGATPSYDGATPTKARQGATVFTFDGWSAVKGGDKIALPTVTGHATYYAHFSDDPVYVVTFNVQGHGSAPANQEIVSGNKVSQPTAPSETGWTFGGWYKEPACTNAWNFSSDVVTANTTLYAKWTIDAYDITYSAGTYGSGSLEGGSKEHGAAYTLSSDNSAFTRAGYTYDGWSTNAASSTKNYDFGASYTTNAAQTFYPHWVATTYTITYYMDGGSVETPNSTSYTIESSAITLNNPTKIGYTFAGWTGTDLTEATTTVTIETGSTGNRSYTATWTPNENTKYTVEHYKQNLEDDGYSLADTTNEVGTTDEYTISSPMSYTGFETVMPIEEKEIAADGSTVVEIYYNRKTYTVTWRDAQPTLDPEGEGIGHNTIKTEQYKYGATPSYTYVKPNNGMECYAVTGWSPAIEPVTSDITYTAVYYNYLLNMVVSDNKTINASVSLNSTTIRVTGHLSIAPEGSLTTTDLVIEASKGASGEITGNIEDVTATNVYFDYAVESDGRHWNVFGVPFEIGDLDATKLQYKKAGETSWHPLILGTHYDITYYDEHTRATQGPVHDCWKYVEDQPAGQRTLQPGIAYSIALIYDVDTLRFTKAEGKPVAYTSDVEMANTNIGDATNGGWNGIANPKTYHALLTTGVTMIQIHDGGEMGKDGYDAYRIADYKFVVGKAGYVQVHDATVLNVTQAGDQNPIPAHIAARRTTADEASELYTVEFNAEGTQTDRVYVRTEEGKLDEYTVGSDVMKMSVSSVRPQLWVDRYNMKLCMNTVAPINGQAAYPLGLYAPAAGEYTIALQPTEDNANTIYLTCDGLVIWNLTYSPYLVQLEKGTNTRYGLQIVHTEAPAVTTGVGEAQAGTQPTAQKVLLNDKVYILRGTNVYTVEGQMVK